MKPHIVLFSEYFARKLPTLKDTYKWKVPHIDGFIRSETGSYDENVSLKKFFNEAWINSKNDEQLHLAKTVVKEWGGVKNNLDSTYIKYIREIKTDSPKTPLKGVASYSKLFSIANLENYAIYDAKVAACLNAIQFNNGINDGGGLAFNYIDGRNNITGNALKQKGFVYEDKFKIKNLTEKNKWKSIPKDETYSTYLDMLKECLNSFPNFKLYDLEMAIFSNAEEECAKAMGMANERGS